MSGRTSDDIRREIERKRAEMDGTVDALDRKLSPGRLLDHALWMLRGSDTGSQKARAVGDAVTGFAKDHPIPVALMSAGAAWLAAESRQGHSGDTGAGTYAPAEGRKGPYMGDALDEGALRDDGRPTHEGDGGHGFTDRAREKATDLKHRVTDAAAEATDRLRDTGESVRDRVESLGDRAREQTSLRADLARERYVSTLEENPLAIGAAAFGLGLAAGLSTPTTRWENERVGPSADALKGEARSIASDAARAARSAGSEALSVVKREALPENFVDEVKDRARRVASDAANAAKDRARAEGLSADALKERARAAAAHTRDATRGEPTSDIARGESTPDLARGDQPRQSAAIEDLT
ncbi:MAG TPA: DUF3618 domain-containing protein [Longimicrobiales bacterium]|nr:DUF3618 domain-containing protein [Longimicrobiales bacterium]